MTRRVVPFKKYLLMDMNSVIRFLILSDLVWNGAVGLLGPIFALFVVDFVKGANPAVVGAAATIYLVTKSLLQVPAASIIDRIRGEKDDFWILFIGSVLAGLMPLSYLLVHTPLQLYIVQFLYGACVAFTFPSYMAIFTRHIDREKEGTEWGIYFTLNDLSAAVTATVGGVLAQTVGFHNLIVGLVLLSLCGVALLFPIKRYMIAAPAVNA